MLSGLQLLRFAAAFSVLIFHALIYGGQFGVIPGGDAANTIFVLGAAVYVFFAVSGFLMAKILDRNEPVWRFIKHRLLRIYPPFFVAVAIAAMLGAVPFSPSILTLLPFGTVTPPLRVEWTLIYEVFFYAVIAALCVIPYRKTVIAAWASAILLNLFTGWVAINPMWPAGLTIALSPVNLVFIVGMTAWWLRNDVHPLFAAVVGLGVGGIYFNDLATGVPNSYLAYTIPSACFVLALWRMQVPRWVSRAGDASYGIYLLHVPVLLACYSMLPGSGWPKVIASVAIALLTTGAFGLLEHHCYKLTIAPRRQSVGMAVT